MPGFLFFPNRNPQPRKPRPQDEEAKEARKAMEPLVRDTAFDESRIHHVQLHLVSVGTFVVVSIVARRSTGVLSMSITTAFSLRAVSNHTVLARNSSTEIINYLFLSLKLVICSIFGNNCTQL